MQNTCKITNLTILNLILEIKQNKLDKSNETK